MGICHGKVVEGDEVFRKKAVDTRSSGREDRNGKGPAAGRLEQCDRASKLSSSDTKPQYIASPFRFSPFRSPFRGLFHPTPANGTPRHKPKWPFPPPSPAKHITTVLLRRYGRRRPKEGTIPEEQESEKSLDISFGYSKNFYTKYELGKEVGRGHFGHTCAGKIKKGELKGQSVAVKVIPKRKMTTSIAIEDVKREVKILRALSGHHHLVKFYDACEDELNVYIVMELCEGGELLDSILARGGKYTEEEAKVVVGQILSIISFCHLQGVVHRDLKPENFLFTTIDDDAELKAIDFGLSDFVRPDGRLNDIVGSAYYVAPEVLHRSYSLEADVWSVGIITYILLCGSRPFWARTESGIFKAVLKSDPTFDETPWPSISDGAKDFVRKLLIKDRHRRMTAVQALTHPWLRGYQKVPLDILIFRLVKTFLRSSGVRKAALRALSKTLSDDHLYYLRAQFLLLEPSKNDHISVENFKHALAKYATEAMKESRMLEMIASIDALQFKKMDFQEFCAAAISVPQLEGQDGWEQQARHAYQIFDKEGNRVVLIEDLAMELGIPSSVPAHLVLHEWVRHNDGKLTFYGFSNLLRGTPPRSKKLVATA
ncbi:hypothetical protein KP509_29G002800 [Ceratopteris richardii]|uniref:Protein kinase domain-containing protein n=1 Tax=Ceratopteris richardii TaxID=49495 RepID=A0A8T2R5B9_CERRI|nr:hypothetical protein KP509_29G002800 [Ceratopteris richardii]KAH7291158.1 hypothetical protein KP509_29G002800 [Ceratopteris richardii]